MLSASATAAVPDTPIPSKRALETAADGGASPATALKKPRAATAESVEAALHAAIDSIESRFATTGSAPLGTGATLRLPGGERFQFPMSSAQAATALGPLIKAATPSAFGHGSQTVLDPTVRKASELRPDAFDCDFSPSDELLEQVRAALVPDAGAVRAELHKLNVMREGDFFRAHKVSLSPARSPSLLLPRALSPCPSPTLHVTLLFVLRRTRRAGRQRALAPSLSRSLPLSRAVDCALCTTSALSRRRSTTASHSATATTPPRRVRTCRRRSRSGPRSLGMCSTRSRA